MKIPIAKGVRDIPPEKKIIKNQVVDTITKVFQLYGFSPLETPLIERLENLTAKGGVGVECDAIKEIFQLTDQGKRKLGLRFDLTVPLARYVAMNPNLKLPFKRYELGRVFRDGPIKLGRYREFWQCDADIIGSNSMLADAECITAMETVFKELKLPVVIKINNRKLMNGILEQAKIESKDKVICTIDKLAKIGKDGVSKELKERGLSKKQIDTIFSVIKTNVTLSELKKKVKSDEGKEGIKELEELFTNLKKMGVKSVEFDASLARGLGYYNGTVYEAFLKKGEIKSSVASGGRYDNLVGILGGNKNMPAVGLSIGIEPIMDSLKKQDIKTPTKLFVLPINTTEKCLPILQKFRTAGISTSFSFGKKGVSKNLQYASSFGIPFVAIIGEDELKKKKILLRNMENGYEQLLSLEDVVKKLK
jgi:histidyl-tRNA synthetase